jgi:hypothetical protein
LRSVGTRRSGPGTCLIAISSGTVYVVTDNDGVDDSTGETQFRNLGKALD